MGGGEENRTEKLLTYVRGMGVAILSGIQERCRSCANNTARIWTCVKDLILQVSNAL